MIDCSTCKHFVYCEFAKQSFIKISDIDCEEYTPVCRYCGKEPKKNQTFISDMCYTCRMKLEKVRELKRLLNALVPYQIQRKKEDEALLSDFTNYLIDCSEGGFLNIFDLHRFLSDFKEKKDGK